MNHQKQEIMAAGGSAKTFTTLKEYDAAVRRSQRKIKELSDSDDGLALDLAKAAHKFLLASRAKFKSNDLGQVPDWFQTQAGKDAVAKEEALNVGAGKSMTTLAIVGEQVPPNAAQVQQLLARDRAREFVPQARVIRERAHAGAMRAHKYAPDDARAQGLGYKVRQRKADRVGFVLALGVKPIFPPMRDATCFLMRNSSRRILVNGQAW